MQDCLLEFWAGNMQTWMHTYIAFVYSMTWERTYQTQQKLSQVTQLCEGVDVLGRGLPLRSPEERMACRMACRTLPHMGRNTEKRTGGARLRQGRPPHAVSKQPSKQCRDRETALGPARERWLRRGTSLLTHIQTDEHIFLHAQTRTHMQSVA